jgi:hypothetical protein
MTSQRVIGATAKGSAVITERSHLIGPAATTLILAALTYLPAFDDLGQGPFAFAVLGVAVGLGSMTAYELVRRLQARRARLALAVAYLALCVAVNLKTLSATFTGGALTLIAAALLAATIAAALLGAFDRGRPEFDVLGRPIPGSNA